MIIRDRLLHEIYNDNNNNSNNNNDNYIRFIRLRIHSKSNAQCELNCLVKEKKSHTSICIIRRGTEVRNIEHTNITV